mgnify:CR=1 FL=1|tara:strand:- start:96 stop:284 length:189 start_codon:yes stop_codon:yes gene_type:complete
MLSNTFTFLFGTILGAYISQNYKIPDIKNIVQHGYSTILVLETKLRKQNESENDSDSDKDEI